MAVAKFEGSKARLNTNIATREVDAKAYARNCEIGGRERDGVG